MSPSTVLRMAIPCLVLSESLTVLSNLTELLGRRMIVLYDRRGTNEGHEECNDLICLCSDACSTNAGAASPGRRWTSYHDQLIGGLVLGGPILEK